MASFYSTFKREFARVKQQYGYGSHSWAEGMTRKAARRIARNRARAECKEMRQARRILVTQVAAATEVPNG